MSDLIRRDLECFWHPCSQMRDYQQFPPYQVTGAEGVYLELSGGHRVIDAISSWWCKALGHRHPYVRERIHAQLDCFDQIIAANTTHPLLVRVCERLLSAANGYPFDAWNASAPAGRLPGWFGKVFLADNGSTGMEIAIKMALQAQRQRGLPQRTGFASLAGGYHGETVATLAVGDCGLYGDPYRPLFFPVTYLHNLPLRCGPEDPQWMDASDTWPAIESQLAQQSDHLAAIVYEPVLQGAGGMRLYSPDLLRRLRAWADAHDVFLIADEIAAGCGRLGAMLASHLACGGLPRSHGGGLPDFAVLSKGLSAGMLPLSAVLTTDTIYQLFDAPYHERKGFLHSNTYTGNALGLAAADAVLDVFAQEQLCVQARETGRLLRQGLNDLAQNRPGYARVRGCGMMAAVDLVDAQGRDVDPLARTGYRVFQEAIRRGAWLRPLGDTLYLLPPLMISATEIERLLQVVADSVAAIHRPENSSVSGWRVECTAQER